MFSYFHFHDPILRGDLERYEAYAFSVFIEVEIKQNKTPTSAYPFKFHEQTKTIKRIEKIKSKSFSFLNSTIDVYLFFSGIHGRVINNLKIFP